MDGSADPSNVQESGQVWSPRLAACASCSAMNVPVPSHHGQSTSDGEPPRFDTIFPVPRQGEQIGGGASSALKTARE